MTARPKNEPIGEVPCPVRECGELCKVYRFKARTEGRQPIFAGKVYCVCRLHGRYGGDGRPAMQDYILEKATIWGPQNPENSGAIPALPANENPANPAPAPKPASPAPEPAKPAKGSAWKPLIS